MKKVQELITVKTETELMNNAILQLKEDNSKITNFNIGGVFRSLLALFFRPLSELYQLFANDVMPQVYLQTAVSAWLDLKAAELGVFRKPATNTTGNVVFSRTIPEATIVIIPEGTLIKTAPDPNGKEYVFMTTAAATLLSTETGITVPIIAEFDGSASNVGAFSINSIITHISGIDAVANHNGWITKEGTDEESDDALRQRAMLKWEQLAGFTSNYYVSLALEVTGIVNASIDDQHPRGQGTIDVIVSSVGGVPTSGMINEVQQYIDSRKHLCDDVLVKAPQVVTVNIQTTIYAHPTQGDLNSIKAEAESIIALMFIGTTERPEIVRVIGSSSVNRAAFIANIMRIENVVNTSMTSPAADIQLITGQIPVKGTVTVTVERSV